MGERLRPSSQVLLLVSDAVAVGLDIRWLSEDQIRLAPSENDITGATVHLKPNGRFRIARWFDPEVEREVSTDRISRTRHWLGLPEFDHW